MWRYANPVALHWGDDPAALLPPLLPAGQGLLIAYPQFQPVAAGLPPGLLDGVPAFCAVDANPTPGQVQQAIDFALPLAPEWILAVGGGSVLDTAKLVRLALASKRPRFGELLAGEHSGPVPRRPLLAAVPTTHGTGAELTMWATVWDKEAGRKLSVSHPGCYPDLAAYCPPLTAGLPLAVSLSTTLDALAHALESLWNRGGNPVSDELAMAAVCRIAANLELLAEPVPVAVRAGLLRASLLAGLAFASTRTAAAHSISYPLTLRLGVPHGVACAITLPALWRLNAPHMPEKAERLRRQLGGDDVEATLQRLLRFAAASVPVALSAYGAGAADLEALVRESFTKGRMENNLVDLKPDDVRAILRSVL